MRTPAIGAIAVACVLGSPVPVACAAVEQQTPGTSAIVAADGSGQYASVQDAINAAPQNSTASSPWTIRVKSGTYHEKVYVQREKRYVRLIGEDSATTVISFGLYASMPGPDGKPMGTFHTPTVWIDADNFTVENLALSNSAGDKGQALALRVDGDRVVFRNCTFLGWQDTILANRGRQYFGHCAITGAVDFIFGGATAFFDDCDIRIAGNGYITAPSTPVDQAFGLVFLNCRIVGETPTAQTYLGRPWRPYGSSIFIGTEMTQVIRPTGWNNWSKPEREKTARFSEFASTGPGAGMASRVPWATTSGALPKDDYSAARVLGGADHWDPAETSGPASPAAGSSQPGQH
jgi:pectinesterase